MPQIRTSTKINTTIHLQPNGHALNGSRTVLPYSARLFTSRLSQKQLFTSLSKFQSDLSRHFYNYISCKTVSPCLEM